jgi:hypothetical protein
MLGIRHRKPARLTRIRFPGRQDERLDDRAIAGGKRQRLAETDLCVGILSGGTAQFARDLFDFFFVRHGGSPPLVECD